MKKEQVTIFNLEDAFKALDEIAVPKAPKGIKANKTDLTESFKDFNRSRTDLLMEEYYDLADSADLEEAKADREAEVAKAKLAKIEKIVDLEASSEEDILPSYVGKMIIQCPQCMTLFYKEEADIVKSETDEETVNVAEICQHCGNETGYTLIGKVEGVQEEELMPEDNIEDEAQLEEPVAEDELSLEPVEEVDETSGENVENAANEEELELAPIEDEEETEEKVESLQTETSEILTEDHTVEAVIEKETDQLCSVFGFDKQMFVGTKEECQEYIKKHENSPAAKAHGGLKLVDNAKVLVKEAVYKELQAKLDAHNEYIKFLQEEIDKEEKALEAAKNDFIKEAIQRRLDALKADLEAALPEEVKNEVVQEEAPIEEVEIESVDTEAPVEIADESNPVAEEAPVEEKEEAKLEEPVKESLEESANPEKLNEDKIKDLSGEEFDELMGFLATQKTESVEEPIDEETEQLEEVLASTEESFEELEDLDEKCFAKRLGEALNRKEKTVKAVKVMSCNLNEDNKLIIECKVKLLNNDVTNVKYICEDFVKYNDQKLIKGFTEGFINKEFICNYSFKNKTLITESIKHSK